MNDVPLDEFNLKPDAIQALERNHGITTVTELCTSEERLPNLLSGTPAFASWELTRNIAARAPSPYRLTPEDIPQGTLQRAATLFPEMVYVHREEDTNRITRVHASDASDVEDAPLIILSRKGCWGDDQSVLDDVTRGYILNEDTTSQFLFVAGDDPVHAHDTMSDAVCYYDKLLVQATARLLNIRGLPRLPSTDAKLQVLESGALKLSAPELSVSGFVAGINPEGRVHPLEYGNGEYTRLF